jgi:heme-degrading monooxygenase HmoA
MYAMMTTVEVEPGKREEMARVMSEEVVPSARKQPGFVNAIVLFGEENRRGVTITFWDSKEEMLKGEVGNVYLEQAGKPTTEHYEVVLEEEGQPPLEDLDVWDVEP